MTIAVLGTGEMGTALARALARANLRIAVASRDPARAKAAASALRLEFPDAAVAAADHRGAVSVADAAAAGATGDVPMCGEDSVAKARVAEVVHATGFRALDCGGLEHAAALEGLTRMMAPMLRSLGCRRALSRRSGSPRSRRLADAPRYSSAPSPSSPPAGAAPPRPPRESPCCLIFLCRFVRSTPSACAACVMFQSCSSSFFRM